MSVLGTVTTVLTGMVFGLAIAAPPGPMNAVIAEESVLRGWLSGVWAGLGAMAADACFFVLALVGVVAIVERVPAIRGAAFAVGGLLMLYFAYDAARGANDDHAAATGERRGFAKAFALAITNPYQVVFWLTIGVGMLEPGRIDVLEPLSSELAGTLVVATGSPALLVGFFAGIAAWVVGFPTTLVAAERRLTGVGSTVAYASALVLAGFGVAFLGEALAMLSSLL
ncbi:LysE family transporter [Halococcus dombrowskii]|uniref:LysE family transporter n=1 Tax=Halococcus dombrowskii TaxID=179637 RepID=A0AAV3SGQ9_HALDO|nr:LysE family transporter [Halococcus dombrowskii]UOO93944.1 LysE family transporter [Halococcus dombrowskii]